MFNNSTRMTFPRDPSVAESKRRSKILDTLIERVSASEGSTHQQVALCYLAACQWPGVDLEDIRPVPGRDMVTVKLCLNETALVEMHNYDPIYHVIERSRDEVIKRLPPLKEEKY